MELAGGRRDERGIMVNLETYWRAAGPVAPRNLHSIFQLLLTRAEIDQALG
ncbi:MAG TPA: hypothetical protein VK457_20810 [Chloroflexota bacterium]|nr:hypothetical protein [Chloroflexota bacterium]